MLFKTNCEDYEYFVTTTKPVIGNSNTNNPFFIYEGISFKQKSPNEFKYRSIRKDFLTEIPITELMKENQKIVLYNYEIEHMRDEKFGCTFRIKNKQKQIYLLKDASGNWAASFTYDNPQIILLNTVNEILKLID